MTERDDESRDEEDKAEDESTRISRSLKTVKLVLDIVLAITRLARLLVM